MCTKGTLLPIVYERSKTIFNSNYKLINYNIFTIMIIYLEISQLLCQCVSFTAMRLLLSYVFPVHLQTQASAHRGRHCRYRCRTINFNISISLRRLFAAVNSYVGHSSLGWDGFGMGSVVLCASPSKENIRINRSFFLFISQHFFINCLFTYVMKALILSGY